MVGESAASELTTKPFTLEKDTNLTVNADARMGEIRVALIAADGTEIPGFGHHDTPPIRSNGYRHPVLWHGRPIPEAFVGKQVQLVFSVKGKAKLFAFER